MTFEHVKQITDEREASTFIGVHGRGREKDREKASEKREREWERDELAMKPDRI